MNAPRPKYMYTKGEDALQDVAAITLTLENKKVATFSIQAEVAIPDDPVELRAAMIRAPAKYAFWAHQADRAERALKLLERDCDAFLAQQFVTYRAVLIEQQGRTFTDSLVHMQVEKDQDALDRKRQVTESAYHYAIIKSLRDACYQRIYVMNKLIDQSTRNTYR